MKPLQYIDFEQWQLRGKSFPVRLSYLTFGPALGEAPIVLVNHALTGNSNVSGEDGWWNALIGPSKTIDTNFFTVIAFNIPGNGYDDDVSQLICDYRRITAFDVADLFWRALDRLGIDQLYALIGGSLGGGIAWEMAAIRPKSIRHLIPVATDWKAHDWVVANVLVQDRILNHSDEPVEDARIHAMLLYRTPESLSARFNRSKIDQRFEIENWLDHHGVKLRNRFRLASYKLMNHLLKTVRPAEDETALVALAQNTTASIHLVAVDSDLFFIPSETRATYELLHQHKPDVHYHEIQSIHGHDAFLIEYAQLSQILSPLFDASKIQQYVTH